MISVAVFILLPISVTAFAQVIAALPVSYGVIVVHNNSAYVEMQNEQFMIEKENASYIQFEGRHIKMYDIKIESKDGGVTIDFKAFRLLDALV